MFRAIILKRNIENLFIFPFILAGRLISRLYPLQAEYEIFFFFPFYTIGGAEKVHAQIAAMFKDKKAIVFFTRKSPNDLLFPEFKKTGFNLKNIAAYTDNKWLYFLNLIFRGIITGYINKQKKPPLVFNGQCNFAYKISPWVKKSITQLELIHSYCSFSFIRIPFLPYYTHTVMISRQAIDDHLKLYRRYNIPGRYDNRILFIANGIDIPGNTAIPAFRHKEFLTALYVGRGTAEKRVHLAALMAKECHRRNISVRFEFMGDVKDAIPTDLHPFCKFLNTQTDPAVIDQVYRNADILLIVSSTEGMPMVIMEGMARGLAIIATAVGDIPNYIEPGKNGFLLQPVTDEKAIIDKGCNYIEQVNHNQKLLNEMASANISMAVTNLDIKITREKYRSLFEKFLL